MKSEGLYPPLAIGAANEVQPSPGNKRARVAKQPEARCSRPEKTVLLSCGVLKSTRYLSVDRRNERRPKRKRAEKQSIFPFQ